MFRFGSVRLLALGRRPKHTGGRLYKVIIVQSQRESEYVCVGGYIGAVFLLRFSYILLG